MQKKVLKAIRILLKGILGLALLSYILLFILVHFRKQADVQTFIKYMGVSIRNDVANNTIANEPTRILEHLSVDKEMPVDYKYQVTDNISSVSTIKYDRKQADGLTFIKDKRILIRNYVVNNTIANEPTRRLEHLSVYKGMPVEYEFRVTDNRSSVWTIKYDNFKLPAPLFSSKHSRELFFKSAENAAFVGLRPVETIKGEIHLVRNGTYSTSYDCGYKSNVSHVLRKRSIGGQFWFHKVVPMYTPETWAFQHFLDSALPKIIQLLHILKDTSVKLLLSCTPRDKIILEILDVLNISSDQIIFLSTKEFGADYLYFTCIAPPIHPVLWQTARRLLGVPEILDTKLLKYAYVVFITRSGCYNCGRIVRNEKDIISLLETRYGHDVVEIFNGGMNLKDTIALFGKARLIIGSHGGGMYNINFAPINTTVIEFMPTRPDGTMEAASKTIFWSQANLLGQIYWRMCPTPIPGSKGDMIVDLNELTDILDITDMQMRKTLET